MVHRMPQLCQAQESQGATIRAKFLDAGTYLAFIIPGGKLAMILLTITGI